MAVKKINKIIIRLINFYVSFYQYFLFRPLLLLFRRVAFRGYGSDCCLKEDFLPMPVHFYSPIPDIADLEKRKIWDKKNQLSGIEFNEKSQLAFLKRLGRKYHKECHWSIKPTFNTADFFIDNGSFSYGCAAILYSMIREFKPQRVIEIGSGNSSKIISSALMINRNQDGIKPDYTIVDPYPQDYIIQKKIKRNKLIRKRVETLEPKFFDQLKKDDLLFIDSSHTSKIGSDVNFLFLEVLSRLKPGVIVHIHDIGLPYEYPKTYATQEVFRQFWTEQYLLQAFLCLNKEYEVTLAMCNIFTNYSKVFQRAFPFYNPKLHLLTSGSFWMRRK